MQAVFLLAAVSGLLYFLLARRVFDMYALAFLSACAYFLPGFVGYVGRPSGFGLLPTEIDAKSYLIMTAVLLTILLGGFLPQRWAPMNNNQDAAITTTAATVATSMAIAGFVLSLLTSGEALASPEKRLVMEAINRWHSLWVFSAIIGAALATAARCKLQMFICTMLLLVDVFIGFRSHFAIGALASATIHMSRQGPQRLLLKQWRAVAGIAMLGIGLMLYKSVYVLVKAGRSDLIRERLFDPLAYQFAFQNSEPFITQAILNEIVIREYYVGPQHLSSIAYLLVPFAPELGGEPISFNSLFQADLFPDVVTYGLANNIWGEMIASGGWMLLSAFLLINMGLLRTFSTAVISSHSYIQSLAASCGAYWAFYIHRNDLSYELVLQRRVLLLWAVAAAIAVLLVKVSVTSRQTGVPSSK